MYARPLMGNALAKPWILERLTRKSVGCLMKCVLQYVGKLQVHSTRAHLSGHLSGEFLLSSRLSVAAQAHA
eukprot:351579-Chlamydomonas_euryale.AAC.10